MKKVFIGLIFIALIVLTGCDTVNEILDSLDNPGETVNTIDSDNQKVRASGTLDSGNTRDFIQVNVPSGLSGDLVYFEIISDRAIELTLYNSQRGPVRESDGPDFFGRINSGFGSSSLSSEGISINKICRGPCIITEKGVGTVFLKVELKIAGTSAEYELYSYSEPYQDEEEPENNDCGVLDNSAIIPVPIDQEFEGALEAVEDIDCYQSNGNISSIALQLTSNTTIDVKAEIFDLNGNFLSLTPNPLKAQAGSTTKQILTISPTQAVIVRVTTDNNRAAPAGNSKYKLSFETP